MLRRTYKEAVVLVLGIGLIASFVLSENASAQPVQSHPSIRIKNDPLLANWDYGNDPHGYIKSGSSATAIQNCSTVKPLVLLVKFRVEPSPTPPATPTPLPPEPDPTCRQTTWYDRIMYENIPGYSPQILSQGCTLQNPVVARSLRQYLSHASFGKFQLAPAKLSDGTDFLPSTLGWITLDEPYSYYVGGDSGKPTGDYPQNNLGLVYNSVEKFNLAASAAGLNLDTSQFDCNGDNIVDALFVIHSHTGSELNEQPSDLRSQKGKWNLTDPINPVVLDSLIVDNYMIAPAYWGLNEGGGNPERFELTIGVLAKLFLHNFDLPDLFDKDGPGTGVGQWSLLGDGFWKGDRKLGYNPALPDAWSRIKLGWLTAQQQLSCGTAVLDSTSNSQARPRRINLKTSPQGDEYYLLENRQAVGFDSNLPTSGLLIWHIDETQKNQATAEWRDNQNEWYTYPTNHTNNGNYLVALEQADGTFALERNRSLNALGGDAGDPFPGLLNKTSFNLTGTPNAYAYDQNTAPGVTVTNISTQPNGKVGLSFVGYDSNLQRGDADGNGQVDVTDAVFLINYIFAGGTAPCPVLSGDADCNGVVNITDAVTLINYIFAGGPSPAELCH